MLFIESKVSDRRVDARTRLLLLEKLQDKGLVPLIRSARLHCFELALTGPERVPEMERAVAEQARIEMDAPYVRGDVFCFEDFVLFLVFGDEERDVSGLRAGIIYEAETQAPQLSLDSFCRNVRDALEAARLGTADNGKTTAAEDVSWRSREPAAAAGLSRLPG